MPHFAMKDLLCLLPVGDAVEEERPFRWGKETPPSQGKPQPSFFPMAPSGPPLAAAVGIAEEAPSACRLG